jgi:23S rRNA pseudouridine2605 synthase
MPVPRPPAASPKPAASKTAHIRLQKVLARAGVASRRHAEELITAGRVRVNGRVATELGVRADPRRDRIEVDGKRILAEDLVYLVLHKPRGVVSTMADPEGRLSVRDYLKDAPGRVYPVGRLDYATSGVLLATNDGDFAEALLHPRRAVPKTYIVKVSGLMADKDLAAWSAGVDLEDGKSLPAKVTLLRHEDGKTWLELTIREGRNQLIRRMGDATGFPVMRLARSSFAGVTSEGLRPGTWRPLTSTELTTLKKDHGVPKAIPTPLPAPRPDRPAPHASGPVRGEHRGRGDRAARGGRAVPRHEPSGSRGTPQQDPPRGGRSRGGTREVPLHEASAPGPGADSGRRGRGFARPGGAARATDAGGAVRGIAARGRRGR